MAADKLPLLYQISETKLAPKKAKIKNVRLKYIERNVTSL